MAEVVLLRHGETEWSRQRKHTGRTDVPLSTKGEEQARHGARLVGSRQFSLALVSPLLRARHTAELAGLGSVMADERLREWDYGGYEGLTTDQIRSAEGPGWSIWTAAIPPGTSPGESLEDVYSRAASVLVRIRGALSQGDVVVVAHGHLLRILTACWLGLPPAAGADLILDPGSVSVLGDEHGHPAINRWNLDPTVTERLT